jgi:hypothetical protein
VAFVVLTTAGGPARRAQAVPVATSTSLHLYGMLAKKVFVNNADDRTRGQGHNPFGNQGGAPTPPANEKVFGPFAGDEGEYAFTLYSDAAHTERVGTAGFVCDYGFDESVFCDTAFQLGHGTLLGKGGFGFEASTFALSIEGGTSAYRNTTGIVTVSTLGQATQPQPAVRTVPLIQSLRLAFTLRPPSGGRVETLTRYSNVTSEIFVNNDDDEARGAVNNPYGSHDKAAVTKNESGAGPFPGDETLFRFGLYSSPKLETGVGSGVYTCQYSFEKTAFCEVTFELNGGTLDADGTLDYGARAWAMTVTGGTGKYHGIGGEVDATPSGAHAQQLTFRLD